jgi:hypothetical protein
MSVAGMQQTLCELLQRLESERKNNCLESYGVTAVME